MNDIERKARRHLLRPLLRRGRVNSTNDAYLQALRSLDDRAAGEDSLVQMREMLSFSKSGNRDRGNPDRALQQIALTKALYVSRRISRSEYVAFASFWTEDVHETRWMGGYYQNRLQPIENSIREIESLFGIGPDEYFPRGEGPPEYTLLQQQYENLHGATFKETLNELGLKDLAELTSREFDLLRERGRRSVFHKDEYVHAIRDVVLQYEKEAHKAASIGAYSAAITALGAGVEGLLLLRCLRSPHKAARLSKGLTKRVRPQFANDPSKWTFETLIEVCLSAGWLPPIETPIARYNTAGLAHLLRQTRNYVHPGRRARDRPWSETELQEYMDAEAIYIVLIKILG